MCLSRYQPVQWPWFKHLNASSHSKHWSWFKDLNVTPGTEAESAREEEMAIAILQFSYLYNNNNDNDKFSEPYFRTMLGWDDWNMSPEWHRAQWTSSPQFSTTSTATTITSTRQLSSDSCEAWVMRWGRIGHSTPDNADPSPPDSLHRNLWSSRIGGIYITQYSSYSPMIHICVSKLLEFHLSCPSSEVIPVSPELQWASWSVPECTQPPADGHWHRGLRGWQYNCRWFRNLIKPNVEDETFTRNRGLG